MAYLNNHLNRNSRKSTLSYGLMSMLIVIAGFCFVSPLQSQSLTDSPSGSALGINGGIGITTLGPGTMTGITFRNGGHQFLFRGISTDMEPASETWEIAGLYGRVISVRAFQLSAGAGVGVVGGKGYSQLFVSGSQENLETMIGFPLEGRITWTPIRHTGLGLHSFANVNTVQPFGGVALTLHLGI